MERLFLLSLLAFVLFSSAIAFSDEDPLIRQVVSETDDSHLLNAEHHFSLFKSKFGKIYASEEEHDHRFKVFKANLRRARRHQLLDPSAEHGITKFSDLTPSEFRRTYLGLHKPKPKLNAEKAPILPTSDLPADFDWRDHGAVTGVKNQVFFFVDILFYYYMIN